MGKSQSTQNNGKKPVYKNITACVAVVAIFVLGWYCWSKYSLYSEGIPEPTREGTGRMGRQRGQRGQGNRQNRWSPERIREFVNEILADIDLTEEQSAEMKKLIDQPLPTGRDGYRERMQEFRAILTPEQTEQFRTLMQERGRARREERLANLPPEEREEMRQRWEQRRQEGGWRGRRGEDNQSDQETPDEEPSEEETSDEE